MAQDTISLEAALKKQSFNTVAAVIKRDLKKGEGKIPKELLKGDDTGGTLNNYQKAVVQSLKKMVREVENLRKGNDVDAPVDIGFGEYLQKKLGFATDENGGFKSFLRFLNIDPGKTKISTLMSMPDFSEDYRWLVPEVIRDAVRTGFLRQPLWNSLVTEDVPVSQTTVKMPQIKLADTPMYKLNEAETIPMGSMQFNEKDISIYKIGTGLELTDEVRNYVTLNVLSEFLASVGVRLGHGLDTLLIQTLVNGDGNGNSAPVIGAENLNAIDYDNDLLRLMIRMSLLGYTANNVVANEEPARDLLKLPEIKSFDGETVLGNVNLRTSVAVPRTWDVYASGVMPTANQWMFLDAARAAIKFTARPLFIESDRIVQNQTDITAVTITTGFAKLFRDASIILDATQTFAAQGFPTWMNPLSFMVYNWENQA